MLTALLRKPVRYNPFKCSVTEMKTQRGMLEQATEMRGGELVNSQFEQNIVDEQDKSGMRNFLY